MIGVGRVKGARRVGDEGFGARRAATRCWALVVLATRGLALIVLATRVVAGHAGDECKHAESDGCSCWRRA